MVSLSHTLFRTLIASLFTALNALLFKCVVPENIHTTPMEGICRMTPPPLWIFQNQPPNLPPSPPEFPQFLHTPGNIAISN